MTTASPFPIATPGAPQVGYLTEQQEVVPGWYARNPHADPAVVVKQDGVPLVPQFTVGQVAPGRRWAIGLDGNIMDQVKFRDKMIQCRGEFYAIARAQGRNAKPAQGYRFERDWIPNAVQWVQWRVDPDDESKLLEIHYDPNATAGAKPDHFVDSKGEEVEGERIEHLCAAYHDEVLRKKLRPSEIAEVEAYLNISPGSGTSEVQAKLEQLTELHNAGDITDQVYMAKVAALTGAAPNIPETDRPGPPSPDKQKYFAKVPCGATGITGRQKAKHINTCEDTACAAAREDSL